MTLTVPVSDAVLARLRERAAELGTTPEEVAAADLSRAAAPPPTPRFISEPRLTREQFREKLDEMAAMGTGKILSPDFSRDDIYDDHD